MFCSLSVGVFPPLVITESLLEGKTMWKHMHINRILRIFHCYKYSGGMAINMQSFPLVRYLAFCLIKSTFYLSARMKPHIQFDSEYIKCQEIFKVTCERPRSLIIYFEKADIAKGYNTCKGSPWVS